MSETCPKCEELRELVVATTLVGDFWKAEGRRPRNDAELFHWTIKRAEKAEAERDVYKVIIEAATLESVDNVSAAKMRERFLEMRDKAARAEKAEAALRVCRDAYAEVYPSIAGRAMQLEASGEGVAADRWNNHARLIYAALGDAR